MRHTFILVQKRVINLEVLEGRNNGKREIRPSLVSRLMLYIAIQCSGTPFRDKVWSRKANSGRLDTVLLGAPCRQIHLWVHLRPEGRYDTYEATEGEECRM
jgi:hypothetical protein